MKKYVLSLNSGSSSVKFNLFEVSGDDNLFSAMQGIAEEIGNTEKSGIKYQHGNDKNSLSKPIQTHRDALAIIFELFGELDISREAICAVGHRVVHGGDKYGGSVLVDGEVIAAIRELIPLAPLHNPSNLMGIEELLKTMPSVPQVAVFDTAFHATIPEYSYRYAIPDDWYKKYGVRRYGFHGTSHLYVSRRAARLLGIPYKDFNCISIHLGNGCSITKVVNGKSADTSLGFTPLEGLIMGTRSGDIDPALIPYVAERLTQEKGLDEAGAFRQVMHSLNRESGLKALGGTNMMQDIRRKAQAGDKAAETVISIYAYRVARYIGAYWATMPSAQSVIFTAGLGENEGYVRKKIMEYLENLQIIVDDNANSQRKKEIIIGKSSVKPEAPLYFMVIPTDEERMIGYDALYLGHLRQDIPGEYPFEK